MTYLQDATHSKGLVGTSSSGASPIIYVMPCNESHEDANVLLVRRNSPEPAGTILDQEISTTTNGEKENFYKTPIQSWLKREALGEFTVQSQFDANTSLSTPAIFRSGRIIIADIKQEDSEKTNAEHLPRREILDRFNVLAQREDNWDRYESKKPKQLTIEHAKFLTVDLLDTIISAGYSWITPFISTDEDGFVTVEWYEEERELHIQIRENEAEYLQVWGINIDSEMREGFLSRANYLMLWEWLLHG